jgi:hypothetical protein
MSVAKTVEEVRSVLGKASDDAMQTLEEATAKAVDRLSSEKKIKLMSYISGREVPKYALAYSVADGADMPFLACYADDELCLHNSVKGRGRHDVVEVIKAHINRLGGALAGIGGAVSGFLGG